MATVVLTVLSWLGEGSIVLRVVKFTHMHRPSHVGQDLMKKFKNLHSCR